MSGLFICTAQAYGWIRLERTDIGKHGIGSGAGEDYCFPARPVYADNNQLGSLRIRTAGENFWGKNQRRQEWWGHGQLFFTDECLPARCCRRGAGRYGPSLGEHLKKRRMTVPTLALPHDQSRDRFPAVVSRRQQPCHRYQWKTVGPVEKPSLNETLTIHPP